MFIIRLNSLNAPILVKLDRSLAYGIIDILAGGTQKEFKQRDDKEFTMIELLVLKEIANLIINDLNEAWRPVEEIKAQYIRTEINSQFIGIVSANTKVKVVRNLVEFDKAKGYLEILYPYSTIFPVRDKLFTDD
jgi:flagellar motor switch protein FliM